MSQPNYDTPYWDCTEEGIDPTEECGMCYDTIGESGIRHNPCPTPFHRECLDGWKRGAVIRGEVTTCPMCRGRITIDPVWDAPIQAQFPTEAVQAARANNIGAPAVPRFQVPPTAPHPSPFQATMTVYSTFVPLPGASMPLDRQVLAHQTMYRTLEQGPEPYNIVPTNHSPDEQWRLFYQVPEAFRDRYAVTMPIPRETVRELYADNRFILNHQPLSDAFVNAPYFALFRPVPIPGLPAHANHRGTLLIPLYQARDMHRIEAMRTEFHDHRNFYFHPGLMRGYYSAIPGPATPPPPFDATYDHRGGEEHTQAARLRTEPARTLIQAYLFHAQNVTGIPERRWNEFTGMDRAGLDDAARQVLGLRGPVAMVVRWQTPDDGVWYVVLGDAEAALVRGFVRPDFEIALPFGM